MQEALRHVQTGRVGGWKPQLYRQVIPKSKYYTRERKTDPSKPWQLTKRDNSITSKNTGRDGLIAMMTTDGNSEDQVKKDK